ncbi:PilW family protein [Tessaracoccus palaemonis]|uniref:Prepilin-type N-terminal cleavage/methylation domain-containing protein n=1 Tax=Tessaracoccus palaemonis TaxID=2829499 RepID=A0ABX8SH87_9ACTN|nr:prepilin-type N-terminal cleavage/methylation domain-containing protein [Tessaracoccus palaemonis]QXT62681.1 prepilin-type N-terminal cleavage/methylation domain-containing protein [Tessaracoccus palaemonis]
MSLLRRLRREDQGLTLVELMVAMGVSGLLLTLVVAMFVTSTRSVTDQQGAVASSRLASTAMNEVTRVVRAGTEIPVYGNSVNNPVFDYAGAEKMIINSFIDAGSTTDPAPWRIQFSRNAKNELVETRWAAHHVYTTYWAFATTASYSRIVARSLLPAESASPLFRYYDKNGDQLTPSAGASLSTTQIRNIAAVQVTMNVQANGSGRTDPVRLQNLVGLPNLGVARVEVK